jgi:hypothetical protein
MLLGGLFSSTSSGHPRSVLLYVNLIFHTLTDCAYRVVSCHLATPVSHTSIPPCEVLSIMEANALLPPACSHVVLAP